MAMQTQRDKVFISYSHRDSIWLEELRPHLGSLAREKGFDSQFWDDTKIGAGSKWQDEIYDALKTARVAILLVSKHFLDSDFITMKELPVLLSNAESEKTLILPVIVGSCRYEHHPELSCFQSVNPPSEPLEGMSKVEQEKVFLEVTDRVDEAISGFAAESAHHDPSLHTDTDISTESVVSSSDTSWSKVVIQSLPDGRLQYQTIRDGSRVNFILEAGQRKLIERLTERCFEDTSAYNKVASTLFELLVPNELKSNLFSSDGTVLILDSTTAQYPWELLKDSTDPNAMPLSVRYPVIRQTISDRFMPQSRALGRSALVIGDPELGSMSSDIPQLIGARFEAENIARLLQSSGYTVETQIGQRAIDTIATIFSQSYQLLHLTGHGVYKYRPRDGDTPITGFILGDGLFFTGTEVNQMRVAPDIVFLNASYLGRHSGIDYYSNHRHHEDQMSGNRFAASLPDQFAANGSRAIIAPCIAIDDRGANTFATSFYQELFAGRQIGQAVLAARRETYNSDVKSLTWGSYICYGDPEYRLPETPKPSAR